MSNPKYLRVIMNDACESITVDVYDVLDGFEVTCPALQHLAKKALNIGTRGHKDVMQDLIDIRDSAERAIELEKNRQVKGG